MIDIKKLMNAKHVEIKTLDVGAVNGEFIKNFRESFDFTQTALANMLGVTKKAIEKWEQGKNNVNGCAKVLLTLLHENPELIEKVYSVKTYERGEKRIEFKPIATEKFQIEVSMPLIREFDEIACEYAGVVI